MNNKTLFYVRPWNIKYYKTLSKFLAISNPIFFSDHKNCGDFHLYDLIEKNFIKKSNYFSFFKLIFSCKKIYSKIDIFVNYF